MRRRALAALVSLWLAVPAWAAEEGGAGFLGVPTVVWKVANFVAFFGLLIFLLARPLSKFFRTRGGQIAVQLEEAAGQRRDAERFRAEMESRVAALAGEITALKERLAGEGERERQALERQGEAEAARLSAQIEQEAARRVHDARRQLASDAAAVAAELAVELLQRELTAEDRDRIFKTTLARLGESPAESAR